MCFELPADIEDLMLLQSKLNLQHLPSEEYISGDTRLQCGL